VYLRFDTAVPFDLRQALSQTYQRAGVLIVEDAGLAELVVELGSFERTISRTARSASGQTTAELIRLAQYVSATRMRDEQSILDTQIVVMRDRQLDPNQLMAAERELQSMTREMLLNLAGQIFDRINRAYRAQA
jgi:LPS-assembly lipoprotein